MLLKKAPACFQFKCLFLIGPEQINVQTADFGWMALLFTLEITTVVFSLSPAARSKRCT